MLNCESHVFRIAGGLRSGALLFREKLPEFDSSHREDHPGAAAAADRHPGEVALGAAPHFGASNVEHVMLGCLGMSYDVMGLRSQVLQMVKWYAHSEGKCGHLS